MTSNKPVQNMFLYMQLADNKEPFMVTAAHARICLDSPDFINDKLVYIQRGKLKDNYRNIDIESRYLDNVRAYFAEHVSIAMAKNIATQELEKCYVLLKNDTTQVISEKMPLVVFNENRECLIQTPAVSAYGIAGMDYKNLDNYLAEQTNGLLYAVDGRNFVAQTYGLDYVSYTNLTNHLKDDVAAKKILHHVRENCDKRALRYLSRN